MSEVKRWKLKGFIPGIEGESKAVFQPTVVLAEDYDAALARDVAVRGELAETKKLAESLERSMKNHRHELGLSNSREAALREKLAYEESDHHTTQVSRDVWREKYEDALKVIQEKDLLLNRSQDFVAFVHKCVRKNKEYAPLHWQEMVELDRDLSALKPAAEGEGS